MKKSIAVFGGGAAALAFASFIDSTKFDVTIYERNRACGRKFLVAGKGGFNLTHSEPIERLKEKYIPSTFLTKALDYFDNEKFRSWLSTIGIPTYVGSSRRVFPERGIKPIEVLNAILLHLSNKGVTIKYTKQWKGWDDEQKPFLEDDTSVVADYNVYAFGGSSWKKTGSTGSWKAAFETQGIAVTPFLPSNCAFKVGWPQVVFEKYDGKPLKNIALRCGEKSIAGEVVITKFGMEGSAIYALSHPIRMQLHDLGAAELFIDLKPQFSAEKIQELKLKSKAKNTTDFLRRELKLSKVQIGLLKALSSKEVYNNDTSLLHLIKNLSIRIEGMAPIDEAISTVGGIARTELTPEFELKKLANSFCIGEMIDWDAPTGGYLLQACFSMGAYVANVLNQRES